MLYCLEGGGRRGRQTLHLGGKYEGEGEGKKKNGLTGGGEAKKGGK